MNNEIVLQLGSFRVPFIAVEPWRIPACGGLYVFCSQDRWRSDQVGYIGIASNLRARFGSHEKYPRAAALGYGIIAVHQMSSEIQRRVFEAALIRAYAPPLNIQQNPIMRMLQGYSHSY